MGESKKIPIVPKQMLIPFVLVTNIFALCGFATRCLNLAQLFFLPLICFVFIAIYGYRTFAVHHPPSEDKQA